MPGDMFGRETILGGVMSAEASKVTFTTTKAGATTGLGSNLANQGLIMQQLNIEYAQNVTRLYALEDARVYLVAGRTEGKFTVQHVVGPQGLLEGFLKYYGNVCNIGNDVFQIGTVVGCGDTAGAGGGTPSAINLKAPLITSFGLQMQAGNMVMASTLQGMFVSLEIKAAGGNEGILRDINTAP
jgi:hypothetical protein